MNTAVEIEVVTDKDYRPGRDEILSYPTKTFSEDIAEYILKLKDNDDLQVALRNMWEWDRDMVAGRVVTKSYQEWRHLVMAGNCVREQIYQIGAIVYANFLENTHE